MSRSYPQQGVGGMDSRYLRVDGSVPLSGAWNAGVGYSISAHSFRAISGGVVTLGPMVNN